MMDPRDRDPDAHDDEPIDAARRQMHGENSDAGSPSNGEAAPTFSRSLGAGT